MRIVTPLVILSWVIVSGAVGPQDGTFAQTNSDLEEKTSNEKLGKGGFAGETSMRVEEPDGSMLDPALATMPESNMSAESLEEVPDAGGGTMVNVEGRFQSILKVPEGSDKAIHEHDPN